MKLTNEKRVFTDDPVINVSIRSWSPIRCMMSPTIFVSKKCRGNRISLARKSDISAMLMRVFTCSNIQLRMKSTDSLAANISSWETNTSVMKFKLLSRTPTSTRLCVRNGKMSCNRLAVIIPSTSCTSSRL